MDIKHQQGETKGLFFIEQNSEKVGELEYSMAGKERMIISHTEVSDTLKGQGAGKQLVQAAVDYARQHHLKVMPLCPFANAVFHRTPDFNDVWDR